MYWKELQAAVSSCATVAREEPLVIVFPKQYNNTQQYIKLNLHAENSSETR